MKIARALSGSVIFETPRLRCRRWLLSDLGPLFAVYSDVEGARWVDDGEPITHAECEAWLKVTADNYEKRGYGMFALEDRESSQVVGFCGLVHPGGQEDAEIKYALLRSHWGRGLASEVVPALLSYGANHHRIERVIATVASENIASQRVLEKAGLILLDSRREEDGSHTLVYHILK
ncbi:MAG: GNAT family N-acetyltransferase [Cyanobacteria bacterium P01_A01_bin.114]